MAPTTRTVRKVPVRRWATHPNQWGKGVVHLRARGPASGGDELFEYVRDGRMWRFVCLRRRSHGEELGGDDPRPVTCKDCLASGWVPKAWQPTETPRPPTGEPDHDHEGAEMALQAGSGAGNYLEGDEWLALGKESALVACVIFGHGTQHMTKGPSAGQDIPKVEFDLYILDGARSGEVHVGQSVIGKGLVAPLSRVSIGEEVAYRVAVGKNGSTSYPQLNAPGDLSESAVALFEQLKAGGPTVPERSSGKVAATVGGGSDANDDEDPPF